MADEVTNLDDFELIEERQRVMGWLANLTGRYRDLTSEMHRRESLRWMVAP